MAFSTQKEFFHVPFMNHSIDFECKANCVKLKSYDSTVDDRCWAEDKDKRSKFVYDLVVCNTPRGQRKGDSQGEFGGKSYKKDGGVRPDKEWSPITSYDHDGNLVVGDSVINMANVTLNRMGEILARNNLLQKKLEDSNANLHTVNIEHEEIKRIMNQRYNMVHGKNLEKKIKQLSADGKISHSDETELMEIYDSIENLNKAYDILMAENCSLKRLIMKQTLRCNAFDNIKIDPERSSDLQYLQNQVENLRKEVIVLRKMEDEIMKGKKSENFNVEHDIDDLNIIIKERNMLRDKCKQFEFLEGQIATLQRMNKEATSHSGNMSDDLNNQAKYINEMENEMHDMQKYYESEVEKTKYNEEVLKCRCDELKEELMMSYCHAQRAECLQSEVEVLRNELRKRDIALNSYDCQYQQLMDVVCELNNVYGGKSAKCGSDNAETQTNCEEVGEDLAFYTGVTLEQIMKEIERHREQVQEICGCAHSNVNNENKFSRDALSFDDCVNELHRLKSLVSNLQEKLSARDRDCVCQEWKNELDKLKLQSGRLSAAAVGHEQVISSMDQKMRDLGRDLTQSAAETRDMDNNIRKSLQLVQEISDVALKNQALSEKMNELGAQKEVENLKQQLQELQDKLKLCTQQNDAIGKELSKLGVDPEVIKMKIQKEHDEEKRKKAEEDAEIRRYQPQLFDSSDQAPIISKVQLDPERPGQVDQQKYVGGPIVEGTGPSLGKGEKQLGLSQADDSGSVPITIFDKDGLPIVQDQADIPTKLGGIKSGEEDKKLKPIGVDGPSGLTQLSDKEGDIGKRDEVIPSDVGGPGVSKKTDIGEDAGGLTKIDKTKPGEVDEDKKLKPSDVGGPKSDQIKSGDVDEDKKPKPSDVSDLSDQRKKTGVAGAPGDISKPDKSKTGEADEDKKLKPGDADSPSDQSKKPGVAGGPGDISKTDKSKLGEADEDKKLKPGDTGGPSDQSKKPGVAGGPGDISKTDKSKLGEADEDKKLQPGGAGGPSDQSKKPGVAGGPDDISKTDKSKLGEADEDKKLKPGDAGGPSDQSKKPGEAGGPGDISKTDKSKLGEADEDKKLKPGDASGPSDQSKKPGVAGGPGDASKTGKSKTGETDEDKKLQPGGAGGPSDQSKKPGVAGGPGDISKTDKTKSGEADEDKKLKTDDAGGPSDQSKKPGEAGGPGDISKADKSKTGEAEEAKKIKPGDAGGPSDQSKKPGVAGGPGDISKTDKSKSGETDEDKKLKPGDASGPSDQSKKPGVAGGPGDASKTGKSKTGETDEDKKLQPGGAGGPGDQSKKPGVAGGPGDISKSDKSKSGEADEDKKLKTGDAGGPSGQSTKAGVAGGPGDASKTGKSKTGETDEDKKLQPGDAGGPSGQSKKPGVAGGPGDISKTDKSKSGEADEDKKLKPGDAGGPGGQSKKPGVAGGVGDISKTDKSKLGEADADRKLKPGDAGGPSGQSKKPGVAGGPGDISKTDKSKLGEADEDKKLKPGDAGGPSGLSKKPGLAGGPGDISKTDKKLKPSQAAQKPIGERQETLQGQGRTDVLKGPATAGRGKEAIGGLGLTPEKRLKDSANELFGQDGQKRYRKPGLKDDRLYIQRPEEKQYTQFVSKTASTLSAGAIDGVGLERELRKILDMFIDECGFCFCKCQVTKSRFNAICHKLYHQGLHTLDFKELAYMHKKIFAAAENILPGCLFNMTFKEMEPILLPIKTQRCCTCRNTLCCDSTEEKLMTKVIKLESDIETTKLCLQNLKSVPSNISINGLLFDGGNCAEDFTFSSTRSIFKPEKFKDPKVKKHKQIFTMD